MVEVGSIELLLVIVLDMLVVELTDEVVLVVLLVELVEFTEEEVEEPVWTELRVNVISVPRVTAASVDLEDEEEMVEEPEEEPVEDPVTVEVIVRLLLCAHAWARKRVARQTSALVRPVLGVIRTIFVVMLVVPEGSVVCRNELLVVSGSGGASAT